MHLVVKLLINLVKWKKKDLEEQHLEYQLNLVEVMVN
jgi:hypothetical protein